MKNEEGRGSRGPEGPLWLTSKKGEGRRGGLRQKSTDQF